MARQIGLHFTGTIDGLSFYYSRVDGYLVRKTGGVSPKRYRNDKRFEASRQASSEFAVVSRAGGLIRSGFGDYAQQVKDGSMVNRLNRELVALKQQDKIHLRGQRRPDVMMADAGANAWFRIFQFNERVPLYALPEEYPVVQDLGGALVLPRVRIKAAAFPAGATHAGLTLVRTVVDFEREQCSTDASAMALAGPGDEASLWIREPAVADGIELVALQVLFFRLQDGDLVPLERGSHAMGVVSVRRLPEVVCTEGLPPGFPAAKTGRQLPLRISRTADLSREAGHTVHRRRGGGRAAATEYPP